MTTGHMQTASSVYALHIYNNDMSLFLTRTYRPCVPKKPDALHLQPIYTVSTVYPLRTASSITDPSTATLLFETVCRK